MKLDIADVATRLRLSRDTVEHLESDRYHALPGRTFARGYLRNYARLLGVAPESLLADFDRLVPAVANQSAATTQPLSARAKRRQPQHLSYALGVAAVALLLLALWWQLPTDQTKLEQAPEPPRAAELHGDDTGPPAPAIAASEDESTTPPGSSANITPDNDDQASAVIAAAPEEIGPPTATPSDNTLAAPRSMHRTGSDSELPAALTPQDDDPSGEPLPPASEARAKPVDSLQLRLAHDSWVEVYDQSGARLYYDLAKQGENIALLGAGPFRLVLGYARDIDIDYNGAPFDLSRYINRDGLARFTLGDVEPTESTPTR